MITFTLENGCVVTVRNSGTEPKVKFYVELPGSVGQPRADVETEVSRIAHAVVVRGSKNFRRRNERRMCSSVQLGLNVNLYTSFRLTFCNQRNSDWRSQQTAPFRSESVGQ